MAALVVPSRRTRVLNGICMFLVRGYEVAYYAKEHSDPKSKYTEDDIFKMMSFW